MKEERFKIPFDSEIEKAVLGAILQSERAAYRAFEEVKEEMFYEPHHRDIYRAMLRVIE